MASIPLHCIACQKKPKFSDVSHLLTHIASKGHLSQYYRLKVKSGSDETSRVLVDQFDHWYRQYGVEELMHERMNIKDKKRPRPRTSASSKVVSRANATAPRPNSRTSNRPTLGYLDPRLNTEHNIKTEARPTPPIASMGSPHPYAPFAGPMSAYYPVPPHFSLRSQQIPNLQYGNQHTPILHHNDWAGDGMSESSGLTSLPATETSTDMTVISQDGTEGSIIDTVEDHAVAECAKLKGVHWPGMDIFDSATPEARRKRNQKKNASVLMQLETNSTLAEATEFVWSPLGNLKRVQVITGLPEDEDMLSSPSKSARKRARTRSPTREALVEISGRQFGRAYPSRGQTNGFFDGSEDDKVENELTYRPKRQRFPVYRGEEEAHYPHTLASFSHPAPMTLLTSPFADSQHYGAVTTAPMSIGHAMAHRANGNPLYHPPKENYQGQAQHSSYSENYSIPGLQSHYHHQLSQSNNFPPTMWSSTQDNISYFQQPIDGFGEFKLSPLKLDRPVSDDDRTITAPNSEI
ncbi:hypothetical protein NA57DRAFT_81934 [Rhizodiscina lignyota]|uniref:Uncharacterized protein n=1 Tax=Rhizodiscina lignyota TaxID=1504668 RepID=A0A9P4LZN7_9PEZI|nr:hypothetical protein NA57DRAFT_81934 [Rhizodiscina lignyota]